MTQLSADRPLNQAIGQKIRARRLALGLRQVDLAQALGITYQQVQKYERGINAVTVARLLIIAGALGVPFAEMVPEGLEHAAIEPAPGFAATVARGRQERHRDAQ